MAERDYPKMSDEELAQERIKLDQQMQRLREEKKKIQTEIDSRIKPLGLADHTISLGG